MNNLNTYTLHHQLSSLTEITRNYGSKRIFLVTGGNSYLRSGAAELVRSICEGLTCYRHHGFKENPVLEDLAEGAKAINTFRPDLLVAIGGGSVIDTAKVIAAIPSDITKAAKVIGENKGFMQRTYPFAAVPTTAGSGSEATHFAVVYIHGEKHSAAHPTMLPDHVILDPSLTCSMPSALTASTGLDAICQAIESVWAVRATPQSRQHAADALKSLLKAFPEVVHQPTPALRQQMLHGAHLAGVAINTSKTTASHALSYAIAAKYNIPHGHAVALTLPTLITKNLNDGGTFNANYSNEKLYVAKTTLCQALNCDSPAACRTLLERIMKRTGLSVRLSEIGGRTKEELTVIAGSVNQERLNNNPKKLSQEEIVQLLEEVW
jgi:alcohol dehydrogenase